MPPRRRGEVKTTLTMNAALHMWLRHYALDHNTTLVGIIEDVMTAWAKGRGFQDPDELEGDAETGTAPSPDRP